MRLDELALGFFDIAAPSGRANIDAIDMNVDFWVIPFVSVDCHVAGSPWG
jgi:hypothetical protein